MESVCDSNQRELLQHTTKGVPCAVYLDEYEQNGYPWHWHDEMELAYIEEGSLQLEINHQKLQLSSGEGIFINTGVLHSYTHLQKGLCRMPNLLFHPALLYGTEGSIFQEKYIKPLTETVGLSCVVFKPDIPWQNHVLEQIRNSCKLCAGQKYGYELLLRNALSEIILQLHLYCLPQYEKHNSKCPTETVRMRSMLGYIQQNYSKTLSVEKIAAAASISKRECLRCFQKSIRQSPMQYVRDWRIEQAKKLLAETTFTLTEISETCGFQSQSYFTRLFRENTGETPGEYRRKILTI